LVPRFSRFAIFHRPKKRERLEEEKEERGKERKRGKGWPLSFSSLHLTPAAQVGTRRGGKKEREGKKKKQGSAARQLPSSVST